MRESTAIGALVVLALSVIVALFVDMNRHTRERNYAEACYQAGPALAMPDEYKSDDPVDSYRLLYVQGKSHLFSYTKRGVPYWYAEYLQPTDEG